MSVISKYLLCFFVFSAGLSSCTSDNQDVTIIKFPDLQKIIDSDESGVSVINFWATWCKPCIEEMPDFEAIAKKYNQEDVKVYLISMDFETDLSRVKTFVKNKGLVSDVVLLNEPDYNSWINKVDSTWSGAIPATLIVNNEVGKKEFFEKQFQPGELGKEIESILKL